MQSGSAVSFTYLALVFVLCWAGLNFGRRVRLAIVLFANYFFCARFGLFCLWLLPLCSTLDFLFGLGLMRFQKPALRRALVTMSVVMNLGLLASSRYALHFIPGAGHSWNWAFPLGSPFTSSRP